MSFTHKNITYNISKVSSLPEQGILGTLYFLTTTKKLWLFDNTNGYITKNSFSDNDNDYYGQYSDVSLDNSQTNGRNIVVLNDETDGNSHNVYKTVNGILNKVSTLGWFSFIWKLFSGFTVSELRSLTNVQIGLVTSFSCSEQGRIKDWYYDITDNTSLDNNGTILVTQSGKRLKARQDSSDYNVENFGAIGDGVTDDTTNIQNAIDYIASLPKGGILRFASKQYCATYLLFKKGCSIVGTGGYWIGSKPNSNGSSIICINTSFQENFIDLELEHSFPQQNGEIDGLPKSAPETQIKNIVLDANFASKFTLTFSQSWGFSIIESKIIRGFVESLKIVDCNEFVLTTNQLHGYLSISNADYEENINDIAGRKLFPALYADRSGLGVRNNNKIYLGGDETPRYKYNITSISNGVFTFDPINLLTSNPKYYQFETTGTVAFNTSTQDLTLISVNGQAVTAVADMGDTVLMTGGSYKVSGSIILSGSSSTRSVLLTCGNVSQTYGTVTAGTSSSSFNFDFTFSPIGNNSTSPIKLSLQSTSITGTDTVIFSNVKILQNSVDNEISGVPIVFNYPDSASNSLRDSFPHSEVFYPKFLSNTTMVLFANLSNYYNNVGYINGSYSSLTGYSVEIPNAVWHQSGRNQGHSCTNNSNKIEDVKGDGVVLRGCYNNVFVGNKISKGIGSSNSRLFCITKGSTKNIIFGNSISARTNVTATDLAYQGIYIDKWSGKNKINNQTEDASYVDVYDEFEGSHFEQNEHIGGGNRYIKKATDYIYSKKRLKLITGKINFVTNSSLIITDTTEFSLLFKNVRLDTMTGDCYLFQQKDISNNTQDGRFLIKVASNGILSVTINASVVVNTDVSTIVSGKDYDILVKKDCANNWSIFIDGLFVATNIGISTSIATSTGTMSYLGNADVAQGANLYISEFQYFNEALLDFEIKNIFTSPINNYKPTTSLLNSRSLGTSSFSSSSNTIITVDTGSGVDSGDCLKLVNSVNNTVKLALNSSDTKNEIVRVSMYVKGSTNTKMGITRKSNIKYTDVTSNYQKVTKYIDVDKTNSALESINLNFGSFTDGQFSKDFVSESGTIYIDYLKVSLNQYPSNTILNFEDEFVENRISNRLNYTDTFYYYDGQGGFYWKKDSTNNKLVLYKNTSASSNTGTAILDIDSNGNLQTLLGNIYGRLFSKSGGALQIGTEGSNSLQFYIANVVAMQLYSNGNLFIGASPSDSGDKLQVSGTSLFTNKIKFSTGSNKPVGSGTLVAGTVAISNTLVTSTSIIILSRTASLGTVGTLSYTKSAGTGFTVTSTSSTDTSTFDYLIIN